MKNIFLPIILFTLAISPSCTKEQNPEKIRTELVGIFNDEIEQSDSSYVDAKKSYLRALSQSDFNPLSKKAVHLKSFIYVTDSKADINSQNIRSYIDNNVKYYLCEIYILGNNKKEHPSNIKITNSYYSCTYIEDIILSKEMNYSSMIGNNKIKDSYISVLLFFIPKDDINQILKSEKITVTINGEDSSLLEIYDLEEAGFRARLLL